MHEIAATWMRGGTSKCWVFRRDDLQVAGPVGRRGPAADLRQPGPPAGRRRGRGYLDHQQGGHPRAVVGWTVWTWSTRSPRSASTRPRSTGGATAATARPWSRRSPIREGWVRTDASETAVRVLNTNTDQLIVQRVPTPGGLLRRGCVRDHPGRALPRRSGAHGLRRPGRPEHRSALPHRSSARTSCRTPWAGSTVTLVDAGAPVVAANASDFGVRGNEDIAELDLVPGLLARLEAVRREAGVLMGLAESPGAVARAVPKLALISAPGPRASKAPT